MNRCARHWQIFGLLLVCLSLWWLPAGNAHATVTCTATMSDVTFANVDIVKASGLAASATLQYTCSNTDTGKAVNVSLCAAIDGGQAHQSTVNPSYMSSGANPLYFNLLLPGGTIIWGSRTYGTTEYTAAFLIEKAPGRNTPATASGSAAITGTVASPLPNANAVPGSYTDSFANGSTALTYTYSNSPATPASCTSGTQQSVRFAFNVTATVLASCMVTAGPTLNLGSVAATATNMAGNNNINVTCTNGTSYHVGLLPSNGNTTGAGVMKGTGSNADKVPYQLRSTTGLGGTIWGNTATSTTVGNGVSGNGNGTSQPLTVYATAPSANYTPDTYTDTVTINVNY